jgi:hypothetical protein
MNPRRLSLAALWAFLMLVVGTLGVRGSNAFAAIGLPVLAIARVVELPQSIADNDILAAYVMAFFTWGGSFLVWCWASYGALSLLGRRGRRGAITRTQDGGRVHGVLTPLGIPVVLVLIAAGLVQFRLTGRNLLPGRYQPAAVEAYQIGPNRSEILWRIEAFPDRSLKDLRYGEVPEGFHQVVPASGAPRPLKKGESLVSALFQRERVLEGYGRALDERRFKQGIGMSSRRRLPRGLSRDQMREGIDSLLPAGSDMRKVRSTMELEGFACRDWSGPGVGTFLSCRRTEMANVSATRTWEISFMPHDAVLSSVLVMETRGDDGGSGGAASGSAGPSTHAGMTDIRDFATRYAAAWSSQNAAGVASFYAPNGSLTINSGKPNVGREAIAAAAQGFMTAFPDLVVKMDDLLQEGGPHPIFRWTATGHNTGPGGTGKAVRFSGYEEWTRGADGLISASLGHYDEADYRRQLKDGVAP